MATTKINGTDYEILVSRKASWSAIEAAGIKVWRSEDGTKVRAYDPSRQGGCVSLKWVFRNFDGIGYRAYPAIVAENVSGAFAAKCRTVVESMIESATAGAA